jgi:hypothetical protein
MDGITWDGSVRFDVGGFDQFSILLDLSAKKGIELGRGHLEGFSAQGPELVLHALDLQRFGRFAIQLLLNIVRRL